MKKRIKKTTITWIFSSLILHVVMAGTLAVANSSTNQKITAHKQQIKNV